MLRFLFRQRLRKQQTASETPQEPIARLTESVTHNISMIKEMLGSPNDLIIREFRVGPHKHLCTLISIDGLINADLLDEEVLRVLLSGRWLETHAIPSEGSALLDLLHKEILSVNSIDRVHSLDQMMLGVLSGIAALLVDDSSDALLICSQRWQERPVEEPQTEALIRGPRDGFTENLRTNTALVRRRLRDPHLRYISFRIGRRSRKEVVLAYIEGIAHPDLVAEVKRRLSTIDMDEAEGSGYIEQWMMDSFLTPFPLIHSTERPDKTASALLQGKVALLVDGSPFTLFLPITIGALFQSPEDYYHHWLISSLMRLLRTVSAFLATFLPALYIALVEYHQGMIPSKLAFSIAGSREGVPFPAVVEAMLMEVTLEVLREAGIRLPKPIGQTIGIVGGLVIGEAAVAAGIVSPIMVIVVAITAISSFSLPSYSFAISLRMLRFLIMLAASMFGLYGIVLVYIMINIHIVNLKSFGVPFTVPFAPFFWNDWKDLILRAPVTVLEKRPQLMQTLDKVRMNKKGGSKGQE
ncbi:spore germination protein [Paenibacillus ehimensis]|uniref:spore germination protein n=1 Tax=Paenibacillus ehimensis TaxID=79264 RepID=UPI00046FA48C|nr:spore germination protein [Paenibacillus ehimensis]